MDSQQKTKLENHLKNTATEEDKKNAKGHLDLAGDDHTHSSAKTLMNWVAGILAVPVIGLSWMAVKEILKKHV